MQKYLSLRFSFVFVLAAICSWQIFAPGSVRAQSTSPGGDRSASSLRMGEVSTNYGMQQNLVITVMGGAKSHLDRQSVIALHDLKRNTTVWQTTSSESKAIFYDLDFGEYDIEVSAVGYKTEHKHAQISFAIQGVNVEVTLQKDPAAADLNATDDVIPPKQRKDAARAVYALKSGNLKQAQKRLDKVYSAAPSSAQLNFLYGYLYLQQGNLEKAESYLSRAATLDPRIVQTLTWLGRVQLQRQQYDEARKSLEQAVAANPEYWLAHNFLAAVYLKQKEYEKAQKQAQIAIDEGKTAASSAYLVLGQAFANVGRDREGIDALKTFLKNNPNDPMTAQAQGLIAKIKDRDNNTSQNGQMEIAADLALPTSQPTLALSAWGPPGVDEIKPSVAPDVACPFDEVIEKSGERVKQLIDNVSRFSATEDLLHEQLDQYGNPITKETRKFDYVAAISESPQGFFDIDENRKVRYGITDLPDHIVTHGFVSLALIFHPDVRRDFLMTCEGLGQWKGQATWVVYFRHRDDAPSRLEAYQVGQSTYAVKMKGRAWITADTFQVVRIESELMNSVPQLTVQHQIAEYGPVHFNRKNVDLWLPQSVDLYLELNKHRYYRRHSFDHYMLFSVASDEKPSLSKFQKAPDCKNAPCDAAGW